MEKIFLANAILAFNADAAVAGIKNTVIEQEKKIDELHRQLGKRTAELEWASKKLKSLDFKTKSILIKSELGGISILKKCALLDFNRSSYYYQESQPSQKKMSLLREIDSIYTEIPFFGYRKVYLQLIENGFKVGVNQVANLMKELGLKVIYPTKKIKTTLANLAHKKYTYLLRDKDINKPNQANGYKKEQLNKSLNLIAKEITNNKNLVALIKNDVPKIALKIQKNLHDKNFHELTH